MPIYLPSPSESECLCQGEILSGLKRFHVDQTTLGTDEELNIELTHEFVIVLTQWCDLTQDFGARQNGKLEQVPDILFCDVPRASVLKPTCGSSDIWKRVVQNKDVRYHFLEEVPTSSDLLGEGLPELGIDFKRYFTIPTHEVYFNISQGHIKRRTRLNSPYLEHLSTRFAGFLSRVALPLDHRSE